MLDCGNLRLVDVHHTLFMYEMVETNIIGWLLSFDLVITLVINHLP
jgi:hypothetical protein